MTRIVPYPHRVLFLVTLTTLLFTTLASSPRVLADEATGAGRSLTIDCRNRHVSQRNAGWLMGTDNFSQTYARRAQLRANVGRACAAGLAAVRVETTVPAVARTVQARR